MHTGKQKQMNASYQASLVIRHIHLFPAKYRQSARISVIVHRFRQYGIEHLLLDTAHKVRYSAA